MYAYAGANIAMIKLTIMKMKVHRHKYFMWKTPFKVHSLFDSYMQQIFNMFSGHVNSKGWHAWDTTLKNISCIHRCHAVCARCIEPSGLCTRKVRNEKGERRAQTRDRNIVWFKKHEYMISAHELS